MVAWRSLWQAGGVEAPTEPGELCRNCGLCCDGTLFNRVRVDTEIVASRLIQIGAKIEQNEVMHLVQPCAAHQHGDCAIYDDRPDVCRSFECGLLREYSSGAIALEEALEIVDTTRTHTGKLVALLQDALGDSSTADRLDLMQRFREADAHRSDSVAFRREHAEIVLQNVRVDTVLREKFVGPRARKNAEPSDAAE